MTTIQVPPFPEGLVDGLALKLNPVIFGSGIPLFSTAIPQTDLTLAGSKTYDNGVVLLDYQVGR